MENNKGILKRTFSKKAVSGTAIGLLFLVTAGLISDSIYNGELGSDIQFIAAKGGNTWVLSAMDSIGIDINRDGNGPRLLYWAASEGNVGTVRWLADQGIDASKGRWAALPVAAGKGRAGVTEYLLEEGLYSHAAMDAALFAAATNNRFNVVPLLLENGADSRTISENSLLCNAVKNLSSPAMTEKLKLGTCDTNPEPVPKPTGT